MKKQPCIICSDGKKRKAIEKECRGCKKSFLTRKDRPALCCSVECRHEARKKRAKLVCEWCSKAFDRPLSKLSSSKSKLYFCSRKCKDAAQRIGGLEAIMPSHYGTGTGRFTYRTNFDAGSLKCLRCGYFEFECSVDIHHIDGNRDNNDPENLVPLCMCCHRALHYGFWNLQELIDQRVVI